MSAARTPRDAACSGRASPRALTAHTRGFTMLELLVVIAIIGMIAVLSPPMFSSSVASAEQRATARSVAQIMRLARSEAIAQRKDLSLIHIYNRLHPRPVEPDFCWLAARSCV